jgi:FlaA1/EpsC-like NDP-sugar epimerase
LAIALQSLISLASKQSLLHALAQLTAEFTSYWHVGVNRILYARLKSFMAQVWTKSSKYREEQSVNKAQKSALFCMVVASVCTAFGGFCIALTICTNRFPWAATPFFLGAVVLMYGGKYYSNKKCAAFERERMLFRKGAIGEAIIGRVLEELSDDYVVLNDVGTEFGNVNHVVVGPTGVYVIEAKDWKGVVEADGNGDLLLNGKPAKRAAVMKLVSTCATTRQQIKALSGNEPLIQAVLALTSAHDEVKWGALQNVDCVTEETLNDYIIGNKNRVMLSKEQINSISRAFLALAQTDRGLIVAPTDGAPKTKPQAVGV